MAAAGPALAYGARETPLTPRGGEDEAAAHAAFVAKFLKDKALWGKLEL